MAKSKPTPKRLDDLERLAAKFSGETAGSMIIGLVGPDLEPVRVVQMRGREVFDVDEPPQILMPVIFEDYLYPAMFKAARGGRGSAKTQSFIRIILARMQAATTHVGCFREIQKSIDESIKQTIETIINDLGLRDQFYITKKEISHPGTGSKMVFAGLKHNVTNVKGMDWIDIAFCEEAENISAPSWNVLIPTLRKPGAELMICYNPKNILDATHTMCNEAAGVINSDGTRYAIVKQINYLDNPFFTETSRMQMEKMQREDPELYDHIWMGVPNADSEQAIIKPSWIEAAVDAHELLGIEPLGVRKIGQDVADEGKDTSALCASHGSIVFDLQEWKNKDVIYTANRAYRYCSENAIDELVYDSIGVGAGVKAQLNKLTEAFLDENDGQGPEFSIRGFNAGGSVVRPTHLYTDGKTNADMFSNIKAQAWWAVRDRFYKTWRSVTFGDVYEDDELISLCKDLPQLEKLKAELSRPRVDYDQNGRTKVESKKDMAKRDIPSPNLADALIMCYAPLPPQEQGLFLPGSML